jgi:hypothetical protein
LVWPSASRSGHEDTPVNMLLWVFMQKGNWGTAVQVQREPRLASRVDCQGRCNVTSGDALFVWQQEEAANTRPIRLEPVTGLCYGWFRNRSALANHANRRGHSSSPVPVSINKLTARCDDGPACLEQNGRPRRQNQPGAGEQGKEPPPRVAPLGGIIYHFRSQNRRSSPEGASSSYESRFKSEPSTNCSFVFLPRAAGHLHLRGLLPSEPLLPATLLVTAAVKAAATTVARARYGSPAATTGHRLSSTSCGRRLLPPHS